MTDWLWWAIGIGTIALGLAIAYANRENSWP